MKLFNKTNMKNKETRRLPMGKTSKRVLSAYAALVLILCCTTTTAFAASDPLTVINNLSEFIFGLIRAIGMILLASASCRSACPSNPTIPASAPTAFSLWQAALSSPLQRRF